MEKKRIIMDDKAMQRAAARITYEILEHNKGADNLCIVGILSRGVALGRRIADKINELEKTDINFGAIDITPCRDDVVKPHTEDRTENDFEVKKMNVVRVDDVIYTGRSARAAIDALIKRGRPQYIQLAVLVDRGHRELPIRPDYVGKNLPTSRNEIVKVFVNEIDGNDCVEIYNLD